MPEVVTVKVGGKWYTVEVDDLTQRPVRAVVEGYEIEVEVGDPVEESATPPQRIVRPACPPWRELVDGRSEIGPSPPARRVPAATAPPTPAVDRPQGAVVDSPPDPQKVFSAPMPGTILSINVSPGDQVVTGDTICVLEAMKMQQHLRADWSGVIKAVLVAVGQQVMDGTPIVELE